MDPARFDAFARSFAAERTRRRVLALLATIPLAGTLLAIGADDTRAERPQDRLKRRNTQHNRKQRNQRRRKKKNTNTGGGLGGSQCGAVNSDCSQDSDCCSGNCFDFSCADTQHTCGSKRCLPPAKGCSDDTCCYGSIACNVCCQPGITQCDPQGNCCAPDCADRQCGDDGCGAGGTCGTCPTGQTCDTTTGQCQGSTTCGAQTCPNGCCANTGTCQAGNIPQACGANGVSCQTCPVPPNGTAICSGGECGIDCDFGAPCNGACCLNGQICTASSGCCTQIYHSCTQDSQCCSYPDSTCKQEGALRFCCGVTGVSGCGPDSAAQCCSGQCNLETRTCA